jgi:hypothetical protein
MKVIVAGAGIGGLSAPSCTRASRRRAGGIMMWRGVTEGEPFLTGRTVAVAGTNAALKFVWPPTRRPACRS